jgi:hypothetical protein
MSFFPPSFPLMNAHYVFFSDEIHLGYALDAFATAHHKPNGWSTANLLRLKSAGISSMSDLSAGCQEETVNLDLELFGIPPKQRLSRETVAALRSFLPGPVGFRCFRLAQMAANKVSVGQATTEYVHRPESGKIGDETFQISGHMPWILHVDCAGFVRNCVKHTTKDPMKKCMSDRDFMRAKDFFAFFRALKATVMDVPDASGGGDASVGVDETTGGTSNVQQRQWRRVDDLRMCIPGDVICYRPRGNAAGGAAFTTNDRKDLVHLLRAIKTAQLWRDAADEAAAAGLDMPLARNYAKDPGVKVWVADAKQGLNGVGIRTVKDLYENLGSVNERLAANRMPCWTDALLQLARECAETLCENTGHIVFCAGPAVHKGNGQYRIRVVHSTKYGRKDENGVVTQGVQEYFRRFTFVEDGPFGPYWTRDMSHTQPKNRDLEEPDGESVTSGAAAAVDSATSVARTSTTVSDDEGDDGDNPNDDMEEDPDEEETGDEPAEEGAPVDDVSGEALVEVTAARMCF